VVVQELFLTETARTPTSCCPPPRSPKRTARSSTSRGREQKIKQAMAPAGESLPDWRILADLMARLGTPVPYFSARDIYREYTRAIPKPAARRRNQPTWTL
jgi:formate dehydrogenase major subunit